MARERNQEAEDKEAAEEATMESTVGSTEESAEETTEETAEDFGKNYLVKTDKEWVNFHPSRRTLESCKTEFECLKQIYVQNFSFQNGKLIIMNLIMMIRR